MDKENKSPMWQLQIICIDIPSLRKGRMTSHCLSVGWTRDFPSKQKLWLGPGAHWQEGGFPTEGADKTSAARWSRLTLTAGSHEDGTYLWYVGSWHSASGSSFQEPHHSNLTMRKNSLKFQQRYILQTIWSVILKAVKVAKNKGSLETITIRRHYNYMSIWYSGILELKGH